MKLSMKDFFSKCDQICRFLRMWSHLLKKFLMENFIFYAEDAKRKIVDKKQCKEREYQTMWPPYRY